MPDALAGSGGEIGVVVLHAGSGEKAIRGGREQLAEEEVEVADLLNRPRRGMLAGFGIRELAIALLLEEQLDARLDFGREAETGEAQLFDAGAVARVAVDAHKHRVDGIDRGAGHEADDDAFLFPPNLDQTLDAIHVSSTSRSFPLCASSNARASAALIFFDAMTAASFTFPSASRMACTVIGRCTPAASSTMRTARLRSFSFVAGMSIIRLE